MAEGLRIVAFPTEVSQHKCDGPLPPWSEHLNLLACRPGLAFGLPEHMSSPLLSEWALSASGTLDVLETKASSPAEEMASSISVKRPITKHSNCHICERT